MTSRQLDLLRYIQGYLEAKGYSPSIGEMADGIGTRSRGDTHQALVELERLGCIRRLPRRARAVEILKPVVIPRGPNGEPVFFLQCEQV